MIELQYERAQSLLLEKRKELDLLAKQLLEKEVLLKSDVEKLNGTRPEPETHIPVPFSDSFAQQEVPEEVEEENSSI